MSELEADRDALGDELHDTLVELVAVKAERDSLQASIAAARSVYIMRKAEVKGFANKTATDMFEALEPPQEGE